MITILIPTYNRPRYLERLLDYYHDSQVAYKIIVADGSSDEMKKANRETVSSFPVLKILHLDRYSPETAFNIRLSDALNHVDTKYCVICADDDFITPNGISQSADFLEKNPDFAVAHGRYIGFRLKDDKKGKQQFFWKPKYSSHESVTFPDPKLRLSYHLSNYSPIFYAVHRTALSQMIWAETVKFINDIRFSELLPATLALIYGKAKCLDVLYCARESNPYSTGRTSKTLLNLMRKGTYYEEYARFVDCLSTHLSQQSQLNVEESRTMVNEAMDPYLKRHFGYKYRVIHIMGRLPRPIRKVMRPMMPVYRRLFLPTHNTGLPISPTNADLNRIRLCVLSHGKIGEVIDQSTQLG